MAEQRQLGCFPSSSLTPGSSWPWNPHIYTWCGQMHMAMVASSVHLYGLSGVNSLWLTWGECKWNPSPWERRLNDSQNMLWFFLVWRKERDVSLSPCVSVQLAFMPCMVRYKHHKALTSVVPSALQHSLTKWKLSLYNSDLYYCMNGAPAFRNYHLQFSFE